MRRPARYNQRKLGRQIRDLERSIIDHTLAVHRERWRLSGVNDELKRAKALAAGRKLKRTGRRVKRGTLVVRVAIAILILSFCSTAHATPPLLRSRVFWTSLAITAAASGADIASTQSALARGAAEANPLYGQRPTPGRMISIALPLALVTSYGAYRTSLSPDRRVRRLWIVGPAASVAIHLALAARNAGVR